MGVGLHYFLGMKDSNDVREFVNLLKHYKKNPGNLASSYRKGVRAFIKENKFDIHPYYWASFLPIGRSEVFGEKY